MPLEAQRDSRCIYLLILNLGTRWRCGQRHAPAALIPGKEPGTHRTEGWSLVLVWGGRRVLHLTGFDRQGTQSNLSG
jgi:hypothetical protein